MAPLFGSNTGASSSKNLVEFRAGKMHLRGTTVTADKRKGLVYVYQSDDSLMHFCWKDRGTGVLEDDLIIFPDDIEFKRVTQCTTGRAYVLKFKSSSRKFFFWMQEPKDDKDEENCKKINDMLNNPPAPGSTNTGGSGGGSGGLTGLPPALASLGDQLGVSSLQNIINNMDQNQLMQLLSMSGVGGNMGALSGAFGDGDSQPSARSSTTTTARETSRSTPAETPKPTEASSTADAKPSGGEKKSSGGEKKSGGAVQLTDLQNILSNMQVPQQQESVDLSSSFSTEALLPLLSDKELQKRLKPFLPAVENLPESENDIRQTIQSPQFKQALSVFSAALQSGQLAPLMQQFKLNQSCIDAAAKGDIIAFVKALQEAEKRKEPSEDEDMALD